MRDLEHFGVVSSHEQYPQPNAEQFSAAAQGIACSGQGAQECQTPVKEKTLELEAALAIGDLVAASLVYDIRGSGTIGLRLNGQDAGELPGAETALDEPSSGLNDNGTLWVRRSIPVLISWLAENGNEFKLRLLGDVDIDRVELELGF